ncbi:hypothetical protein K461DRAFT_282420 [Myriangium duriaei CBS 260.36]|uniref:Ubiquitin-protein ligase (Asi3) n=1 Tax=Myriangium duriaei CBS 260.36 TaxID=1168546 RepID=A0A9P4IRZ5_9PEZI|nr:hypothetical protein K461DRAFT_282420 [Myriangium duriaei CBS 260.36]
MAANSSLIPSAMDLVMVLPRLAQRAGSFASQLLPEQVDSVLHKIRHGGSVIADATSTNVSTATMTKSVMSQFVQATAAAKLLQPDDPGLFSWFSSTLHFEGARGFGSMFSYFSSRWALATFTVSIFLNRTHFYASSRQNLRLRWKARLCLYLVPITLLLVQTLWVLQAIRCQTSPDFPLFRYGDPNKNPPINFGGEAGFLHWLSSTLLFWQDDAASCAAMNMSIKDNDKLKVLGSFSFVWPFFVTICISQFADTLACALQGAQPMPETGMTTFEHSLAFAECEAMISNALGLGIFGSSKQDRPTESSAAASPDSVLVTRSMVLRRLNVPSEVLLISFISCLSHLSSSILAVSGKRNKYRLVNTGIWATCYLGAFIWSFIRVMHSPLGDHNDLGILRFPTVCIVGFIPHMLILCGIIICASIYALALLMTVISPPPDAPTDLTISQRFSHAFHNLQANVQFSSSSSTRLNWQEDFYTNLLKIGFNILTAASEAVYLNEGSRVKIHNMTWLEQKRLQEIQKSRERVRTVPSELQENGIARGLEISDQMLTGAQSGYANERKSRAKKRDGSQAAGADSGLGLSARRNRWELVVDLLSGVGQISARMTALLLSKLGFEGRTGWLFRHKPPTTAVKIKARKYRAGRINAKDFWIFGADGTPIAPKDSNVDVEVETRRQLAVLNDTVPDTLVDDKLYSWWKNGGWWGDLDGSGDYTPPLTIDDDTTSVISESTVADTDNDWESEDDSDGRRTPTRSNPLPSHEVAEPPAMADLVRLLDPRSPEEKEEARLLSQHLQSSTPLTRAAYSRRLATQRGRILMPPSSSAADAEADEEAALEAFILARRRDAAAHKAQSGKSWAAGAEGLGSGGPVCVVCQSAPRSVLVWPCGCLSVCDDCRVGVAARNFSTCLCCRTGVVAYSRLYVP